MLNDRGSLKEIPITKVLLTIYEQGLTGILSIDRKDTRKTLYFKKGSMIWAGSNSEQDDFESILTARNLVASRNIERVKKMLDAPDTLARTLVEKGLLTLEDYINISREQIKQIAASIMLWPEGEFRFTGEEPPEGMLILDVNISELVHDFILEKLGSDYIRQYIENLQAEFVKNPDQQKLKKYNLAKNQLELLVYFDNTVSLDAVLEQFPLPKRETILRNIYYFLMAEFLVEERLEFMDKAASRGARKIDNLEIERSEYDFGEVAGGETIGKEETEEKEDEAIDFERIIEVQKPPEQNALYNAGKQIAGEDEYAGDEGIPPGMQSATAGEAAANLEADDLYNLDDEIANEAVMSDEDMSDFEKELAAGENQDPAAGEMAGEMADVRRTETRFAETPGREEREISKDTYGARFAPGFKEETPEQPYVLENNRIDEITSQAESPAAPGRSRIPDEDFAAVAAPDRSETDFITADVSPGPAAVDREFTKTPSPGLLIREEKPYKPGSLKTESKSVDRDFMDDDEPIEIGAEISAPKESFAFKKTGGTEKKRSRQVSLIFLLVALIFIIAGAIFLYLKPLLKSAEEERPVDVAEKQPVVQRRAARTEIEMKKEGGKIQETAPPADRTADQTAAGDTQKAVEPAAQTPGALYERFDIKNDELERKLQEKDTAALFMGQLGDPQAVKFFKEGNLKEAGNAWNAEVKKTGVKFAILLEMDCLKESVVNAYLRSDSRENFYVLNRKLGDRDCYLVLWGRFYTKEEAADVLKNIPQYFWQQEHPPEVISLATYL